MFKIHKSDTGSVKPWEYLPAAAGSYVAGQALSVAGGQVTPITAVLKTTPPYICQATVTVTAGQVVPVTRVGADEIYETSLSAKAEGAVPGALLEISAGGLQVDAAANGTFEVVAIDSTEAGGTVYGRFK